MIVHFFCSNVISELLVVVGVGAGVAVESLGYCEVRIAIPENWFPRAAGVTGAAVEIRSNIVGRTGSTIDVGTLLLSHSTVDVTSPGIYVRLPNGPTSVGETIVVAVENHLTLWPIQSYMIRCSASGAVEIDHVVASNQSVFAVSTSTSLSGDVQVTAVPGDGTVFVAASAPPPGVFFSLALRPTATASSTAANGTISCSVLDMIAGMSPYTAVTPPPAVQFSELSGTWRSGVGEIRVSQDQMKSLYAYTHEGVVINTAVITGSLQRIPMSVYAVDSTGTRTLVTAGLQCVPSDPTVLNVDSGCSHLVLHGNETQGSNASAVVVSLGSVSYHLVVKVFFPVRGSVRIVSRQSQLKHVRGTGSASCASFYQCTVIQVFGEFASGSSITELDLTMLPSVLAAVSSTPSGVVALNESVLCGLQEGATVLGFPGATVPVGELSVTVVGTVVAVQRLDVFVVSGVEVDGYEPGMGSALTAGLPTSTATATLASQFAYKLQRGHVLVQTLWSDGTRSPLHPEHSVNMVTSEPNIVNASGRVITAVGEFGGNVRLTASWMDTCQGSVVAAGSAYFRVGFATPERITVQLNGTQIGHPDDRIAMAAGLETALTVTVTFHFSDGRTTDVTSDPRVVLAMTNSSVGIGRIRTSGGLVLLESASAQSNGTATLLVSAPTYGLQTSASFTVARATQVPQYA